MEENKAMQNKATTGFKTSNASNFFLITALQIVYVMYY